MTIDLATWKWNRVFRRWECVKRNQSYDLRADAVAWLHAWPALVEKRLQLSVQLRELPAGRIAV
jgi:hypothetical protein